jgi:hypothetical protein
MQISGPERGIQAIPAITSVILLTIPLPSWYYLSAKKSAKGWSTV